MLCHLLTKLELTASASMAQRLTDDCVFQWVKKKSVTTHGNMNVKFNAVHFPCNYITYVKLNTKLLHNTFVN